MKEYKVLGEISPKKENELQIQLEKMRQEGTDPIEGELEKTPEQLKFIKRINFYLSREFEKLGIDRSVNILPEQLHILPHDIFKKISLLDNASAQHDRIRDSFYIDGSEANRFGLLKFILHESIHSVSFQKDYIDLRKHKQRTIEPYRSGYNIFNPHEGHHQHFEGLGEAVIDKFVDELFNKYLYKEFNIDEKERKEKVFYYNHLIKILDIIIDKIAKNTDKDKETVWQEFKKGQFGGELMHLREVEKAFGKGSLRVLAALDAETRLLDDKRLAKRAQRFFEVKTQKARDAIAREILIERERMQYEKVVKKD